MQHNCRTLLITVGEILESLQFVLQFVLRIAVGFSRMDGTILHRSRYVLTTRGMTVL